MTVYALFISRLRVPFHEFNRLSFVDQDRTIRGIVACTGQNGDVSVVSLHSVDPGCGGCVVALRFFRIGRQLHDQDSGENQAAAGHCPAAKGLIENKVSGQAAKTASRLMMIAAGAGGHLFWQTTCSVKAIPTDMIPA